MTAFINPYKKTECQIKLVNEWKLTCWLSLAPPRAAKLGKNLTSKNYAKNNTRGRPIYCQKSVWESSNRHARWKFGRILFIVVHVWRASWTTAGVILKLTVGWNGAEAISRRSELEWVSFWERQNHTSARSRRKTEDRGKGDRSRSRLLKGICRPWWFLRHCIGDNAPNKIIGDQNFGHTRYSTSSILWIMIMILFSSKIHVTKTVH